MNPEDGFFDQEVTRVNTQKRTTQHVEFRLPKGSGPMSKKKPLPSPSELFTPSPDMIGAAETQLPGSFAVQPLSHRLKSMSPMERSFSRSSDLPSFAPSSKRRDLVPPATVEDVSVTPLPPSRPQSREEALREWQMINDERNSTYQRAMVAAFNSISRQRLTSPSPRNTTPQNITISASGVMSPEKIILEDPLLQENPVAYFAKNKDGPVKFVYLNQAKFAPDGTYTPYNLKVVPFSEVEKEYYTMSSNGVTYVGADGHSEFIPMARWVREADLFSLISRLDVFRQYKLWKPFRLWRKYVRRRRYKHNRSLLNTCIFTTLPLFRPCLVDIVKLCEGVLITQLIRVKPHASYSVSDFMEQQSQQRRQVKDTIGVFVDKIVHFIEDLCKSVCNPDRTKLPDDDPSQQRIKVSLRQILLMEKQKALERAKIAEKVNSEIKKIGNLVRLVDYIMMEYAIRVVSEEFKKLLSAMELDKATIFRTDVIFNTDDEVDFNPNMKQLKSVLTDTLTDVVNVVNGLPRVVFHPPFRKFLKLSSMDARALLTTGPSIRVFLSESKEFIEIQNGIYRIVEKSYGEAAKYARIFNDFKSVYQFGRSWDVSSYRKEPVDLRIFSSDLSRFQKWIGDIDKMQTASSRSILQIDSKGLKATLTPIPKNAMDDVKSLLLGMATERTNKLLEELRTQMKQLAADPSSLAEFCDYMDHLKKMPLMVKTCTQEAQLIDDMFALLEDYQTVIASHEVERHSLIHSSMSRFKEAYTQAQSRTIKLVPTYVRMLERNISSVNSAVETIITTVDSGAFANPDSHPGTLIEELGDIRNQLVDLNAKAEKYAEYQAILDLPVDATRNVLQASENVEKVYTLWTCVDEWQRATQLWDTTPFIQLKREEIEATVNQVSIKVKSILADKPGNNVAQGIHSEVERYQSILSFILDLANPAMRPRHWKRLFSAVNDVYVPEETIFTLTTLLQNGILEQKLLITEVSAIASGEHSLELTLDAMRQVWAKKNLTVMQMRNKKDIFIIAPVKDIMEIIDDHQISLSQMLESQYIAGIQEDVEELRTKLILVEDVLEQWVTFQQYWLELEGIFSQDEAPRQLPTQTNKFRIADRRYKTLMRNTRKEPNVVTATTTQGVLQMFVESNGMLENVLNSLREFVDSKRQSFPRLYFLSDAEALSLLSGPTSPSAQACIRKCFENVWKLEFVSGPGAPEIVSLVSGEQEKLTLSTSVRSDGLAESWLIGIMDNMRTTLHSMLTKAVADHLHTPIMDWYTNFPSQVVLAVHHISWSSDVQLALDSFDPLALKKFQKVLQSQLNILVEAQKSPPSASSRQQKQLFSTLIMHLIHGVGVVQDLADQGINSVYHFAWTRQMRYYWDTDSGHCLVRQGSNTYQYGYEYTGNTSRLVLTPSTERAQISIALAMKSAFSCMVFGPDGIGKTETIRDLARNLARFCVYYSCSSGLSLELSLAFFKGAVQSGAFLCLEDMNKLSIQVLSVISQHVSTVLAAMGQKGDTVSISGATIPLNRQVAFFGTLVGNYTGTSLPENLKSYFRPVSIYDPDRELITEVYLKSEGFSNSADLSRRINLTYTMMTEQLNPQPYHSFGMRTLKNTIMLAGALKRMERQGLDDVAIIARAVRDVNMSRLKKEEIHVFTEVMASTFPGVIIPDVDYSLLLSVINSQLGQSGVPSIPSLPNWILQLYELMIINRGVVIIGEPGSGKTTCYSILAQSLSQLAKSGLGDQYPMAQDVKTDVIFPAVLDENDLIGHYNPSTELWEKGIISKSFQQMASREGARSWLVFDGGIDNWADMLLSLLDETKTLHLPNGERLRLPTNANILMETVDISKASPALLSRMGIFHITSGQFYWSSFTQSWLSQFTSFLTDTAHTLISSFFRDKLDATLLNAKKLISPEIPYNPHSLVNSLCMLMKIFLMSEDMVRNQVKEEQTQRCAGILGFCIIWSIGAVVDVSNRQIFCAWIKQNITMAGPFPETSGDTTLYDFYFNQSVGIWCGWNDLCVDTFYPKMLLEGGFMRTTYNIPYYYILDKIYKESQGEIVNIMLTGDIGTSKTTLVHEFLERLGDLPHLKDPKSTQLVNPAKVQPTVISYRCNSSTTSRHMQHYFQTLMISPRKNIIGGKCTVVFVDDLNMCPIVDSSQKPTLFNSHQELIRQIISTNSFYDRKTYTLQRVQNMRFIATNCKGLREDSSLSSRLLRQFYILNMPTPTKKQLLDYYLPIITVDMKHQRDPDLTELISQLTEITIDFYLKLRTTILPVSDKSTGALYIWKPKDLSHAFQSLAEFTTPSPSEAVSVFTKLWCHETLRVFVDRLSQKEHQTAAIEILQGLCDEKFTDHDEENEEIEHSEHKEKINVSVIYQDVLFGQIRSREALNYAPYTIESLGSYFTGIWSTVFGKFGHATDDKMSFFPGFLRHMMRLLRILRVPSSGRKVQGRNAILISPEGSGRNSICRLAGFLLGYEVFYASPDSEMDETALDEHIKKTLKEALINAGVKVKQTVFFVKDWVASTSTSWNIIFEIMGGGMGLQLFSSEELEVIRQSFEKLYKSEKGLSLSEAVRKFCYFVQENFHIVMCLNPARQGYATLLQNYTAVADCAIDHYNPWDIPSLTKSAFTILEKWDYDDASKDRVATCLAQISASIHGFGDFFSAQSCQYPMLPSSRHFSMVQLFVDMHTNTRAKINEKADVYQSAMDVFAELSKFADSKKDTITDSKPLLDQAESDASNLLGTIMRDKKIADEVRSAIEIEEKTVATEESELEKEKEKSEELIRSLVRPIERTTVHLGSVPEKDITDIVEAGPTLTIDVQGVLACISVMFGREPTYNTGIELLLSPGFIRSIINLRYHEIPPERAKLLKITMDASNLDPEIKIDYKASKLPQYLADYVFSVYNYLSHQSEIKKADLRVRERTAALEQSRQTLTKKRRALEDVEGTIVRLQQQYDACQTKGENIIKQMHTDDAQIQKAQKIIANLDVDYQHWTEKQNELEESKGFLLGSALLAAATLTYLGKDFSPVMGLMDCHTLAMEIPSRLDAIPIIVLMTEHTGPFNERARTLIIQKWTALCDENLIPVNTNYTLASSMGIQRPAIKEWENMGLLDQFSIENGLLVMNNPLYPIIYDPLGQAAQWIKNMHSKSSSGNFTSLDVSHNDFSSQLETAISLGSQVLIVLPSSAPHPLIIFYLRQLVYGNTESEGKKALTTPDGRTIVVHEGFRLFMTIQTEQSFTPETYLVCSIVNFNVTPSCMDATFFKQISQLELSETEKRKESIQEKILQDQFELSRVQEKMVSLMNTQKLNVLLDDRVLEQLDAIKSTISNLNSRIESATFAIQEMKDESRNICQNLASRATQIFRATQYLPKLHSFYRVGISQFGFVISSAIEKAPPTSIAIVSSVQESSGRIQYLTKVISFAAYSNIARGLSHSHRLLFAFLMAAIISKDNGDFNDREFDILMRPASMLPPAKDLIPKPTNEEWLSNDTWRTLIALQQAGSKTFANVCKNVTDNLNSWRVFSQHPHPHRIPLPEGLTEKMPEVIHILLVKLFCPAKLNEAMSDYVSSTLGSQYLEPISADIERAFVESKPAVPILLLVRPGYDPSLSIQRFAVQKSKADKLRVISMSPSMVPFVKRTINQAASEGYWLLLQNCHLVADSWIPTLARVVEELQAGVPVHQDFRLWLSTESTDNFSVSLVRRSIRVWCEPSNGIRTTLSFLFRDLTDHFFTSCKKVKPFKKLVFSLGFFHGILMGRRWFGQTGFQTLYEFTESDLQLAITQLREYLNEHGDIPYSTLQFLIAEIIYGGRVLNRWDKRLLRSLLQEFLNPQLLEDKYTFFGSTSYHPPGDGPVASIRTHIDSFPIVDKMDALGLNEGTRMTGERYMSSRFDVFLKTMFDIKPSLHLMKPATMHSQITQLIIDIEQYIPKPINLLEAEPKVIQGPHRNILAQECDRINKLIQSITRSISLIKSALSSPSILSFDLQDVIAKCLEDRIPQSWGAINVRYNQPLRAFLTELKSYVSFFQEWLGAGTPIVFWLSAFARPETIITYYLKDYASRNGFSVDQLTYDHLFLPEEPPHPPHSGFYGRGLNVRGASWDPSNLLTEATVFSQSRHTQMPVIWFKPVLKNDYKAPSPSYNCPVLRVTNRMDPMFEDQGVPESEPSCDGNRHINFLRPMQLPADQPEKHWIKRGVVITLRTDAENI